MEGSVRLDIRCNLSDNKNFEIDPPEVAMCTRRSSYTSPFSPQREGIHTLTQSKLVVVDLHHNFLHATFLAKKAYPSDISVQRFI